MPLKIFKIVHVGTLAITHHNITYKIMLLIKSGVKISLNFGHASHVTRVTSRESRFGFHQCHYIISVTYPGIDYYSKSNNLKSLACRTELKQWILLQQRERKNKCREKLKTQELYEQHKIKNAGYSKSFREGEQERLDKMVQVKTTTLLNKRRKEDRNRQRKTRNLKRLT